MERVHLLNQQVRNDFPISVSLPTYMIVLLSVGMGNQREAMQMKPTHHMLKEYELLRFLGFTNFYHWFIRGLISLAASLTSLLKGNPKTLQWTMGAHQAFQVHKDWFTSAPILCHPEPSLCFTVEVDAPENVIGAVQHHGEPSKYAPMHLPFKEAKPNRKEL